MKKTYEKPEIEVSIYLVNEAFAACTKVVDLGPSTATTTTTCKSYSEYEDLGERSSLAVASGESFYVDQDGASCGCYYTSGNGTLLSS